MSTQPNRPQPNRLTLIRASELDAANLPDPPKEIIGEGQIAILAATFGRGKTPLLAQMLLEAACSVPLTPLGLSSCRRPVMVLDYETTATLYRQMLRRVAAGMGIRALPESLLAWFRLDGILTPGIPAQSEVRRVVAERKPGLLVIDPLRSYAHGLDLMKPDIALSVVNSFRELQNAAPGLRIISSHHLRKRDLSGPQVRLSDDPWDWLMRVSGSLALLDHVDVRLGFEEADGKLVLAGIKRGVGVVGPWYFEVVKDENGEPCGFRFEDARESGLNERQRELLDKLPQTFTWGAVEVILETGPSTVSRLLKAAMQEGLVRKEGKGYVKVEARKQNG